MHILLIGSGAREHALAWKLTQSPLLTQLSLWPGNPLLDDLGSKLPVPADASLDAVAREAQRQGVALVICGPELPLAAGLTDILKPYGLPVFGPSQQAALLETSKVFAKSVMAKAQIPTPEFKVAHNREECRELAQGVLLEQGSVVLKADGLASGKGVFICETEAEISEAVALLFAKFETASQHVLIEHRSFGRECSYFALISKSRCTGLGFAVDFKRLQDRDQGPNTGGMGAYTPVPWLPLNAENRIHSLVLEPLLETLKADGIEYVGFLYVGLMWTQSGPEVLEFNVRLGDPEAQVLAVADQRDWLELILHTLNDEKSQAVSRGQPRTPQKTVGVVMASSCYPYGNSNISANGSDARLPRNLLTSGSVHIFGASVSSTDDGSIVPGQGRVMTCVATHATFAEARNRVYAHIAKVQDHWHESQFRGDIARRVAMEELNA